MTEQTPFNPPTVTSATAPDTYTLAQDEGSVEYLGVRVDGQGLHQIQEGAPVVTATFEAVEEVVLRKGIRAERPFFQTILGLILFIAGLYPLYSFVAWLVYGGELTNRGPAFHMALLAGIPIGVWLMIGVLRPGLYLEVQLTDDRRRLSFTKKPDSSTLDRFLAHAERISGKTIRLATKR